MCNFMNATFADETAVFKTHHNSTTTSKILQDKLKMVQKFQG